MGPAEITVPTSGVFFAIALSNANGKAVYAVTGFVDAYVFSVLPLCVASFG